MADPTSDPFSVFSAAEFKRYSNHELLTMRDAIRNSSSPRDKKLREALTQELMSRGFQPYGSTK